MSARLKKDTREEIAKQKRTRFPHVWIDDAGTVEPTPYLVKGILDARSNGLIYGPSGQGKTFFAIDLAAHIATGIPWRGRRVNRGLVVYVAAEAGTSIVKRFRAWADVKLSEARDEPIPLSILTRGANLLDELDAQALMEKLDDVAAEAKMPLSAVLFDTLSRSIPGGDENSAQDITSAIQIADRIRDELGAATVFVHHSGKDTTKGARGHSALFAAADSVISVADRVATVEKSRDGMSGESFGFRLDVVEMGQDEDGDPITTCVLEPQDTQRKTKATRLPGAAQVAMGALREAIDTHGQALPETSTIPPGVRAVELMRWREQFRIRYGTDDRGERALRQAFQRGREHLLRERLIGISDPYVWTT